MNTIKIKPLSVNDAWKGRRFKTDAYKHYEKELMYLLPRIKIPSGPLRLIILVGFSNRACDADNMVKPFQDILQKKYGFNDKDIYELRVVKFLTRKKEEYIQFLIEEFTY